ncbi:MAG: uroporphyrinogen decarboxylase family protein [Coriobacteriales bacterium]
MNSMEKYQKMQSLTPYADRSEMPVYPMMITSFASVAGFTQKEYFEDVDKWLEAADKTFSIIGHPTMMAVACPADTVFNMYLPSKRPGYELGDDDLYQFIETPYFDDPDAEYAKILEMGWDNWFNMHTMAVQNPPMTDPQQLMARYGLLAENLKKSFGYCYSHDILPWFDNAFYPIYDSLSMFRSMEEFLFDFIDNPGPIMDIINKYSLPQVQNVIQQTKQNNGWHVCIFPMRCSATFISPDMFEEYVWPALKLQIEELWKAEIYTHIHADGNWLPMLEYFTELPKGCCHIELDESTDIEKAYEILQGSQSIRGNVPSVYFAFKDPEDVAEYSEKLVKMGMNGGFMLSSSCEIPMNAKPENIKAMMDVLN